ncbi:5982_t:CDS:10 [Diversispora eburnea]|uniref:5982_t:CDS:1 n=1 Tax=Diversispora eburnea TaxID=1213867 RepID=A0A9N9ABI2_9GLOM|nr:5982_t:CDS:10 [Diversispora eburnea]
MSLRPKRIVFDKVFDEFKLDLEQLFNFSGLDRVSGMKMYHAYARKWKHYQLASQFSSMICEYLNKRILDNSEFKNRGISTATAAADKQQFVEDGKYKRQTIHALAYLIWKERVINDIKSKHSDRLMYQIFEMIRRDRDGEDTVPDVVTDVINSLVELNFQTEKQQLHLYQEEFEKPYLKMTRQYYERESAAVIANGSISQYMNKACERLNQEVARNKKYCHESSHETIIKECETQYVAAHQSRIHGEFESMISSERFGGVNPLLEIFEQYITNIGKGLIAGMGNSITKDPREYVESLMNHHIKYMNLCHKVFINDAAFVAAVDKAFRTVVNDVNTNPVAQAPEVLARYCDVLLKRNIKGGWSEQEVEDKLNRMKDIYQKFYSRMLAKRLIYGNSASEEAEANMISRLKNSCGVEYTSKLQRMFTDITISSDINDSFAVYMKKTPANDANGGGTPMVDFSILVLTAGAWPLTQASTTEFQLPTELERNVSHFSTFYNGHHTELKLNYLDKRYEFSVSLHQLGVLLLFNIVTIYTFKDIRDHTGLTETPQENDATRKGVDEDRKLYLQASIVRVMKSRQTLSHNLLIKEVIDQAKTRFNPNVAMIKKLFFSSTATLFDNDLLNSRAQVKSHLKEQGFSGILSTNAPAFMNDDLLALNVSFEPSLKNEILPDCVEEQLQTENLMLKILPQFRIITSKHQSIHKSSAQSCKNLGADEGSDEAITDTLVNCTARPEFVVDNDDVSLVVIDVYDVFRDQIVFGVRVISTYFTFNKTIIPIAYWKELESGLPKNESVVIKKMARE